MTENGGFEPNVCIVTPVFNGSDYIDETIASVVLQAGSFRLRYHIQDGGSTDDTIAIVKRWHDLVTSGALPLACKGLEFTYSSERDAGMYDAINRGFEKILPASGNPLMGWINADDRLAQGGLSTGLAICDAMPETKFFGGRVALLDQYGSNLGIHLPITYSRPCMAAGLYDGRSLSFVMQEGTFWRAELWRICGGLNDRLKLAGDWDLWRRFAQHSEYASVDSVLGFHRRRPGQLSGQMDKYYAEVDQILSEIYTDNASLVSAGQECAVRFPEQAAIRKRYESLISDPHLMQASGFGSTVLRFNMGSQAWEPVRNYGLPAGPPEVFSPNGVALSNKVHFVSGFSAPEGPHPELSIPFGVRWLLEPEGFLTADIDQSGRYEIVIRCRAWAEGRALKVSVNGRLSFNGRVRPHGHDRETEIRVAAFLPAGNCEIEVAVEAEEGAVNMMFTDWRIDPVLERPTGAVVPVLPAPSPVAATGGRPPSGREWPRISVIVPTRNQGPFIADTLRSLIRQGYPNLEIIVCDGASTDETTRVLREFERYIAYYISEPDKGQSNAINKGMAAASGDILTWLNSDDLLASGALHAVAFAFLTEAIDMVSGVCDVFGVEGTVMHRHLPCLQPGPLPLNDLLDLENCWLRGEFFHQPEVFFSRAIWEKAGGSVREDLYYSMDYDLWVRMAKSGAKIQLLGRTIAYYRMHADQKTSTVEAYRPELTSHVASLRADAGMPPMPARREDLVPHLKILMFNDYGFKYGAGIAHRRLAQALQLAGQDVVAVGYAEFDQARPDGFDPELVRAAVDTHKPDLIVVGNLHSIGAGTEALEALLSLEVPIVFFAHDQWIVTGRCAYTGKCTKFLLACDASCPTVMEYPSLPAAQVEQNFRDKRALIEKATQNGQLLIVTNSHYMEHFLKEAAGETLAHHIQAVPLGVDTRLFNHGQRRQARQILGLPQGQFIILTAAASIEDERKGLPLLMEALKGRPELHDALLVIIGSGRSFPKTAYAVHFTGYVQDERLVSLYFQAADIFVGPSREEALGQTFIEAGACGTPSVAFRLGGIPDVVIDGVTGLLVDRPEAEPLGHALLSMKSDAGMRRSMGANAVLHIRNRFSLEMMAAGFLSLLTTRKFGRAMSPSVNLRADGVQPVHFRYLATPMEETLLPDSASWFPIANIVEDRNAKAVGLAQDKFFWATALQCALVAEAPHEGTFKIRIRYRKVTEKQHLRLVVNGHESVQHDLEHGFGSFHQVDLPLRLQKGYNRIVLAFSDIVKHEHDEMPLALMIAAIVIGDDEALAASNRDGRVIYLENFAAVEGPYPEFEIDSQFRWATGDRSAVRIFSAREGERALRIGFRNFYDGQVIGIDIGSERKMSAQMDGANGSEVQYVIIRHHFREGFHDIAFHPNTSRLEEQNSRWLSFALNSVEFQDELPSLPESAAPILLGLQKPSARIVADFDEAEGFGPLKGPFPELNLMEPIRWITSPTAVLRVEATAVSQAILRMTYRSMAKTVDASLRVNGVDYSLELTSSGAFCGTGEVEVEIGLCEGTNILEFAFDPLSFPAAEEHARVLLLENLTITDIVSGVGLPDGMMSGTPSCYPRVKMGTGVAEMEDVYPELDLHSPFYWVCDKEARINVQGNGGNTRVRMQLRNFAGGQRISIWQQGNLVVQSELLPENLAIRTEIEFDIFLTRGWNVLDLTASVLALPAVHERR
ncbi:hypothetical protein BH10PSE13_BH10PSE13_00010 [soil metagenome]